MSHKSGNKNHEDYPDWYNSLTVEQYYTLSPYEQYIVAVGTFNVSEKASVEEIEADCQKLRQKINGKLKDAEKHIAMARKNSDTHLVEINEDRRAEALDRLRVIDLYKEKMLEEHYRLERRREGVLWSILRLFKKDAGT